MIIAVSFVTSFETGVTASIAVIAHEIPQEIGDFALLIKGRVHEEKGLDLQLPDCPDSVPWSYIGILL